LEFVIGISNISIQVQNQNADDQSVAPSVLTHSNCSEQVLLILATEEDWPDLPSLHASLIAQKPFHSAPPPSSSDNYPIEIECVEFPQMHEGCACRHLALVLVLDGQQPQHPRLVSMTPAVQASWQQAIKGCSKFGYDAHSAWFSTVEQISLSITDGDNEVACDSDLPSLLSTAIKERCNKWADSLTLDMIPEVLDDSSFIQARDLARVGMDELNGINGKPDLKSAREALEESVSLGYLPGVIGLHYWYSEQGYGSAEHVITCANLLKLVAEMHIEVLAHREPRDTYALEAYAWFMAFSKNPDPFRIIQYTEDSIALDPDNYSSIHFLSAFCFATGVPDLVKRSYHLSLQAAKNGFTEGMFEHSWHLSDLASCPDVVGCFYWLKKGAELGNFRCQTLLGQIYNEGKGVEKNVDEAIKWFRLAVESNYSLAMYELGMVLQDSTEGCKLILAAAEQYLPQAEHLVGVMYLHGEGTSKDEAAALKWLRRAANHGHLAGQFELASLLEAGIGEVSNIPAAINWFRIAASRGHPESLRHLGELYRDGIQVEQSFEESVKWFLQAAELGDADAQHHLGVAYEKGEGVMGNIREAMVWYRKAAEQEQVDAFNRLGCIYESGIGGVEIDLQEARVWFRMAAGRGDADAQCKLGYIYYLGNGVIEDATEAKMWFQKSAAQGNTEAQLGLISVLLSFGDDRIAVSLCRQLAESGNAQAQAMLGDLYHQGQGVAQCNTLAVKWLKAAHRQGLSVSKEMLEEIYSEERKLLKRTWEQFANG
jgi:TPR repeat protein